MSDRILVVAAHPDDEVLGCGGTMAALSGAGHEVYLALMGRGVAARSAAGSDVDGAALAAVEAACRKAAHLLGVKQVFRHDFPDNAMDSVPLLDVIKAVEAVIAEVRPLAVLTHHGGDLNVDHRVTHQAVLTATRPLPSCPVKDVYGFEVLSSTEWAFGASTPFLPNVFVEIGLTLDSKVAALACYESEVRPFPHPRAPEALRAAASRWGSVAGLAAAEPFMLIRSIRAAIVGR